MFHISSHRIWSSVTCGVCLAHPCFYLRTFSPSACHPDLCDELYLSGICTLPPYFDPRGSCSSLFDRRIFSTCLSPLLTFFPFTFCLVRYVLHPVSIFQKIFQIIPLASTAARLCRLFLWAISIVIPVCISSARSVLAPSLSCLYTHFFVSPLPPDSPSIFHLLDLTSPRFNYHGSVSVSPLRHCPFPSRLNRCECLSSISLFAPCPLPSTLFSLFIYHSSRALPLSFSLFLS